MTRRGWVAYAAGLVLAGAVGYAIPRDPTPPRPRRETVRAIADGHRLIAEALARRHWGADDRAALRAVLAQVDRADGAALLGELVPAINDGRLEVATGGTPF